MATPAKTKILGIRLDTATKTSFETYCKENNTTLSKALKDVIENLLEQGTTPQKIPSLRQTKEPSNEPKTRVEILLTPSEKAAIKTRANLEGCTQRRWIIDAIRAGLTHEPQFTMSEVTALGESNYQLLAIGRNLNQMAKRLNENALAPVAVNLIERLHKKIEQHTDTVTQTIRASLERWNIE